MILRLLPLLAAASLAAGCNRSATNASEGGAGDPARGGPEGHGLGALQRDDAPKVLVAPLAQREMVRRISTTTTVESEREIELFPRIGGRVVELFVEEGERVARDAVLLKLDPREAQGALDEAIIAEREAKDAKHRLEFAVTEAKQRAERARLTLEQSERELERKELVAEGLLSKNELEQLRLTRDQHAADLAAQQAAISSAEAELVSQDILISRAALQVAKATLELSFTEITAPFEGVIAERRVRVGDLVSSGAAVLTLTDPDHVRAVVYRPQRELAFFHAAQRRRPPRDEAPESDHAQESDPAPSGDVASPSDEVTASDEAPSAAAPERGEARESRDAVASAEAPANGEAAAQHGEAGAQRGEAGAAHGTATNGEAPPRVDIVARPEAMPGHEYVGHIRIVSPTVDATSGQFRVTLGLDQPEDGARPPLLPGMLLRVEIVTERHPDALVVPKRALVREGEAHFVFVVREGVARRVRVSEGFSDDLEIEVVPEEVGALAPGDSVVVVGNRDLEDGDRVEAEPWTGAAVRADAASGS